VRDHLTHPSRNILVAQAVARQLVTNSSLFLIERIVGKALGSRLLRNAPPAYFPAQRTSSMPG